MRNQVSHGACKARHPRSRRVCSVGMQMAGAELVPNEPFRCGTADGQSSSLKSNVQKG